MSFHINHKKWTEYLEPENCPICKSEPMPEGMEDIFEMSYTWLSSEPKECIKGACHVISKVHAIELFDLSDNELFNFMSEVCIYAEALKNVTKAIKINYEIHGNTIPHLHLHLYPRYLDDPYPNQAINYQNKSDSIYAPGEYDEFIDNLRQEIYAQIKDILYSLREKD